MSGEEGSLPYLDGWDAHRNGIQDPDSNPYHEKLQPRSHLAWLSGWCARFDAIKHGLPLEYD